ncbi:MAG: AraC family transcriptional regulator [Clostridia bacterium]|nr:AraC family transcriptional regulator [Clostridia bacterium]
MPILLDHQLREQIPHTDTDFAISYFHDELVTLPNWAGPMHWHPDFEIATAVCGTLDYQVGHQHITLHPGDSVFVNGNMLHGIRQLSGTDPDPMPNIVFSGSLIAPETSLLFQKYIHPIARCDSLPFIVFRKENPGHNEVNGLIRDIYTQFTEKQSCYEMTIQRDLNRIFAYLHLHFADLPKSEEIRVHMNSQIRFQKMLTYISEHYTEAVTLEDIAQAANISRSEAGRCFHTYMGCSPIEALIQYRLQAACRLLNEKTQTLQQISYACGFNSVNYFSRQFKKTFGYAPSQMGTVGK